MEYPQAKLRVDELSLTIGAFPAVLNVTTMSDLVVTFVFAVLGSMFALGLFIIWKSTIDRALYVATYYVNGVDCYAGLHKNLKRSFKQYCVAYWYNSSSC